ncbi:CDP-alcohol phosphatidyltransferase family protein [candidate division KSB1 bacterium]|nr:CDP-alcohol phosphatidyltransferase family protein [candidate division KSB1 bacterium]
MATNKVTKFFADYMKSLKRPEVEEILDIYFYRVLAFLFVKSIYKTRCTPNQLTGIGMILGVAAGFFYAIGSYETAIIGSMLFLFSTVLDCADGQLARLKRNGTRLGRLMDGLSDYVVSVSILLGIATGYEHSEMAGNHWWLVVLIVAISGFIQSFLADYFKIEFLAAAGFQNATTADEISEFSAELERLNQKKERMVERVIIFLYIKYLRLQTLFVRSKDEASRKLYDSKDYLKKNRLLIRWWSWLGPSTRISLAIILSLWHRFDILFWIIIIPLNIYWIILLFFQRYSLRHTAEVVFEESA